MLWVLVLCFLFSCFLVDGAVFVRRFPSLWLLLFTANNCSNTYRTPPMVRVSPPDSPTGVQAEAKAVLDKRTGTLSAIEITNPGSGYSSTLAPVAVEVRNRAYHLVKTPIQPTAAIYQLFVFSLLLLFPFLLLLLLLLFVILVMLLLLLIFLFFVMLPSSLPKHEGVRCGRLGRNGRLALDERFGRF